MNMQKLMSYPFAIFDLDGTLVDSMPYWRRLGRDYLLEKGIEAEPDMEQVIRAMTVTESAQYFREHYRLSESPAEIVDGFDRVMEENYRLRIPAKPGVPEYLERLYNAGIDLSICSATASPQVDMILKRLDLRKYFSRITSCDEAGYGKYRPDAFRLALERAGARPEETVMYEDADYAVRTAVSTGMHVAAVYDPFCTASPEEMAAEAEFYIRDFRELISEKL